LSHVFFFFLTYLALLSLPIVSIPLYHLPSISSPLPLLPSPSSHSPPISLGFPLHPFPPVSGHLLSWPTFQPANFIHMPSPFQLCQCLIFMPYMGNCSNTGPSPRPRVDHFNCHCQCLISRSYIYVIANTDHFPSSLAKVFPVHFGGINVIIVQEYKFANR